MLKLKGARRKAKRGTLLRKTPKSLILYKMENRYDFICKLKKLVGGYTLNNINKIPTIHF